MIVPSLYHQARASQDNVADRGTERQHDFRIREEMDRIKQTELNALHNVGLCDFAAGLQYDASSRNIVNIYFEYQ